MGDGRGLRIGREMLLEYENGGKPFDFILLVIVGPLFICGMIISAKVASFNLMY